MRVSAKTFAYRALIRLARIRTSGENAVVAFFRSCDLPNSTLADAEVFPWIVRLSLARGPAGQAALRQSPEVYAPVLSHYPPGRFARS